MDAYGIIAICLVTINCIGKLLDTWDKRGFRNFHAHVRSIEESIERQHAAARSIPEIKPPKDIQRHTKINHMVFIPMNIRYEALLRAHLEQQQAQRRQVINARRQG